jgi:RNA polymerase sigma-70 factor (ECF subfamily)
MCKRDMAESENTYENAYNIYYSKILGYFSRKVNSYEDAEDLTSEVFLYCYKNWHTFDARKASAGTWIFLIAKSRYKNYLRDRKMVVPIDEFEDCIIDASASMEDAMYMDYVRSKLFDALVQLTERQRYIVVMRYFKGKTVEQIANTLKISPNNVRVQQSKALKRMKHIMEMRGEYFNG